VTRSRLVLFDIDGTLITDHGAARHAFATALAATFDYTGDLARYDFSGRTDPQIARMILHDAGWSEPDVDASLHALWRHYLAGLARNAPGRVRELHALALRAQRRCLRGLLKLHLPEQRRVGLADR